MCEVTERQEGVEDGTVKIISTDVNAIVNEASRLIDDRNGYEVMSNKVNPYGDGTASKHIVQRILEGLE